MPNTAARQGHTAAKRSTAARSAAPAIAPAHFLAHGRLHRAIVSLPQHMCPSDEPLHERIVFFDVPSPGNAGLYLVTLLAAAWNVDAEDWRENGLVYNVRPARDLFEEGMSADENARLFEMGWDGPQGVSYAEPRRVDLFVAPALKARLQATIDHLAREGLAA
ncbi:hypothetical protein [Pantoea sp. 18069]|uniref:hypothetical protein n=1 Tax=Pantoea sp. 18069 TaxID=2681415 RepID=UPI0013581FF8|nr:hypothetical protein [Pantoea sp. 18069]